MQVYRTDFSIFKAPQTLCKGSVKAVDVISALFLRATLKL